MADEILRDNETESQNEKVDAQTEKTVPVSELQRRLESQNQKHAEEIENLKQSQADAIAQAIERYKAETELTGKELEEYRKREAEREKQELINEINALKAENVKRALKDEAINTLAKHNVVASDNILTLVVKDTAEDTLKAIDGLLEYGNSIRNELAQSKAPTTGSNLGESSTISRAEFFRSGNILKNKK